MRLAPAVLSAASSVCFAHMVDMGSVNVRAQCAIQRGTQYSVSTGKAPVTAIMEPRGAHANSNLDLVSRCAMQAKGLLESSPLDSSTEAKMLKIVNACLSSEGAGFQLQWLVLRRGPAQCEGRELPLN